MSLSPVLELAASYLDSKSVYTNPETNKTYFKVFLLNNFVNKRKFRISNLKNLHNDVDGYENLPVTLVEEGLRKGNHPNPKDANIFESSYQNKYSYITNAISYYRKFEVAKIVKIYKPDLNLITAAANGNDQDLSPLLNNYYALCETQNQKMITMLDEAEKLNKKIYVSPAMFSWSWEKDPDTGIVSVDSFVPTHLAIVDKPAYDPDIAYIKKELCKKDGMSCYYQLLEASELENLNNDTQQKNNMSANNGINNGTKAFTDLEAYLKSQYSLDVVDLKNIPAEEVVKGLKDLTDNYKNKVVSNNDTNPPSSNTAVISNNTDSQKPITQFTTEKEKEVKTEVTPKEKPKEKTSSNFTLEDVQKLLVEQEERILNKFKEKETKAEREQILDTYIQNEKIKSIKDKIDPEKLKEQREFYNKLPFENDLLKQLLNNSIYNPNYANQDIYKSVLALSEANRELNRTEIKQVTDPKTKALITQTEVNKLSQTPITDIPPKTLPNINSYGTEFKNSSDNGNRYNDSFKGTRSFEGSANNKDKETSHVPITGDGIPRRFQKYIN